MLRTLGGLGVEGSGFTRPKPLLLLAYLTLEGPQSRRHLAELFWPGNPKGLRSLTTALTRLKHACPGSLHADDMRVFSRLPCDVRELAAALEEGELFRALRLYEGPFLDGAYLPSLSVELEEWLYETRETLAEQVQDGLLAQANGEAGRGRFDAAATWAERAHMLPGAPPLPPEKLERVYCLLSAAEHAHAPKVRKEAESYGIRLPASPHEARTALDTLSLEEIPHNLPVRGGPFVGRSAELAEISRLLARPECRLLTLTGPGGIGKTRLALQAAREGLVSRSFKDGVYFVELEPLQDAGGLPSCLADSLALGASPGVEPLRQVVRFIGSKQLLLVLDNFEHVLSGATLVTELLEHCPNLNLLTTSRESLGLPSEWVLAVEGLSYPENDLGLEGTNAFDAVRLFAQRARQIAPGFTVGTEDIPHVMDLCRLLRGAPLGLELAAAWTRLLSCKEIAAEVAGSLDFLTARSPRAGERHQSLRAVFARSWSLLGPREQDALAGLSCFRGGATTAAARAITAASLPVLASLQDKSLLAEMPTGRHELHPLVQQYAAEKLAERPALQQNVLESHAETYTKMAGQFEADIHTAKSEAVYARLDSDLENVKMAWSWAASHGRADLLERCCLVLRCYFDVRSKHGEGLKLFADAGSRLSTERPEDRLALGSILEAQALFQTCVGKHVPAAALARQGLELLRSAAPGKALAFCYNTAGSIANNLGSYREALGHYSEARKVFECLGYRAGEVIALCNLANVNVLLGRKSAALAIYDECSALAHGLGSPYNLAIFHINLGQLRLELGDFRQAEGSLHESLRLARRAGSKMTESFALEGLGHLAVAKGDFGRARTFLETALALEATLVNGERADGELHLYLAEVMSALSDEAAARRLLAVARTNLLESGRPAQSLRALARLAELKLMMGKMADAAELLAQVIGCSQTPPDVRAKARTLVAEHMLDLPEDALGHATTNTFEVVLHNALVKQAA